jgi:ADP-ribosylglycohydrolase
MHKEPEKLLGVVREQTAMTHNNPVVIESAVLITKVTLEALKSVSPLEALENLVSVESDNDLLSPFIKAGLKSKGEDTRQTIRGFGQVCEAESALPSVVHLLAKYESDTKNGLIENVMAGGDSAGRGMIVGMILGAYHGESSGIPHEWMTGLKAYERIVACLEKIE